MSYRGSSRVAFPELESQRRLRESEAGAEELTEDLTDEQKKKGMMKVAKKQKDEGRPGVGKKIAKKAKSYFEARRARFAASMRNFRASTVKEVSPPGWEGTVKAMKKNPEVKNPWALAHSMKNKGMSSHK